MWKKIKIIVVVLVIVLLVPVVATVFLNQTDTKNLIRTYIQSTTGRELTIEGHLAAKWGWSPVIYARQIRLSNSDWARTPYAFTAEKITISLSFTELIRGQIGVTAIELDRPQLWVERNPKTNIFNLDMRSSPNNAGGNDRGRLLSERVEIKQVVIKNGSILYFHEKRDWDIEIHSAKLESSGNHQPTRIHALGEVEKTTLSVSGEAGSLNAVLSYREAPVELNGYVGDRANQFSISGVIGDLIRWRGLNLWVDANIANLSDLAKLFGFWVPPYRDISATGELIQPGSAKTMRMESIKLESSDMGLRARAEGEIGRLVGFSGVDMVFSAAGNLDKQWIPIELAEAITLETSITGRLSGDKDNLILNIEHGQVLTPGAGIYANGVVSNVAKDWSSPLAITMNIDSLGALGNILNIDLPASGAIRASADLNRYARDLGLSDIHISSRSDSMNLAANGRLGNLGANTIGELVFDLQVNQKFLGEISKSKYLDLIHEVSVHGILAVENAAVGFSRLNFQGIGQGLKLEGSGGIDDLVALRGLNLDVRLHVESLSNIHSITGQKLPASGPLILAGNLYSDENGAINLQDLSAKLRHADLSMDITGEAFGFGFAKTPAVNLVVEMGLNSIKPLDEMYPQTTLTKLLSPLLPMKGRANLSGDPKNNYSLKNILVDAHTDQIAGQMVGDIHNLFPNNNNDSDTNQPSGLDGKLSLNLTGTVDTPPVGAEVLQFIEPSLWSGDLDGSMDVVFGNGRVGLDAVDFNINSGQSMLHVSGSVDGFTPVQSAGLKLEFAAAALGDIFRSTDSLLNRHNPTTGVITVTTSESGQNIALDLAVANSDLKGEIIIVDSETGNTPDGYSHYQASLTAKNFDLTRLLVKNENNHSFFSHSPISLDWIGHRTADIAFSAESYRDTSFTLNNFASVTSFAPTHLQTSISGKSGQGTVRTELGLEKLGQGVNARLAVRGEKIDLSALTKLGKTAADNAGIFSLEIDLDGSGDSISSLVGNASGTALLELSGAKIKNDGLEILGGDLFLGLLDAINPLSSRDDYLDIECGVINLDIANGIAGTGRGLALKTRTVTLLGEGEIDLGDETLRVFVRPKARKGFGINTNSIVKLIRVGGTLTTPEIEADPKGLLQSSVALGAALASGGLSLLAQGIYDKSQANTDVCSIAANRASIHDTQP